MYDKLLKQLNSTNVNMDLSCFKNSNLTYIQSNTLTSIISLTSIHPLIPEDQSNSQTAGMLLSQIKEDIIKTVTKFIYANGDRKFIDMTSKFGECALNHMSLQAKSRYIVASLSKMNYNHILSGVRVVSEYLADSPAFSMTLASGKSSGALMYPFGCLNVNGVKNIFVDPIMTWSSNYILLFDDILIDTSNCLFKIHSENTFSPKLEFKMDFKFDVINPKVVYIFEDDYMEHWGTYKQINRDTKIDYILNDSQASGQNNQSGIYGYDKLEP